MQDNNITEVKYTFYIPKSDNAEWYLDRIQQLLLAEHQVLGLREDVQDITKGKLTRRIRNGKVAQVKNGRML